eukprot:CAMPEP_0183376652 /NCGR_PEP_ID=MMETSP0164_2-20130417/120926_1 /TAXON_ID=221442 /ORGANISM="Coccolithus pelagicus ssp braarudi, Strain PLY182g" /LENGTH=60 /DNA_ID=CAMNT_0025554005 /DNA_START=285 /DNA_END=467 /DNA_ORIENTATION=+
MSTAEVDISSVNRSTVSELRSLFFALASISTREQLSERLKLADLPPGTYLGRASTPNRSR